MMILFGAVATLIAFIVMNLVIYNPNDYGWVKIALIVPAVFVGAGITLIASGLF